MNNTATIIKPSSANREDYIAGMRNFFSSVCLITSSVDSVWAGMTATAVCSVSADPPTLLVCINFNTGLYETVSRSGVFAVNVLSHAQVDLAEDFSGRLSGEKRFSTGNWNCGATGVPILEDSVAAFECQSIKLIDMNTHCVTFGQVEAVHNSKKAKALLYGNGAYGKVSG